MAIKRYKGLTKTVWLPVTPSTVIPKDGLVSWASGLLIAATAATTAASHAGVAVKGVAATDADYALSRSIPVIVPVEKHVQWLADFTSGLVVADVGLEVDLTSATVLNRAASAIDAATVVKFISLTKGIVMLNLYGGKA